MRLLAFLWIAVLGWVSLKAQPTDCRFYFGNQLYTLSAFGSQYDLQVDLLEFGRIVGLNPRRTQDQLSLSLPDQVFFLNLETSELTTSKGKFRLRVVRTPSQIFFSIRDLLNHFPQALGKQMIYEPVSKTLFVTSSNAVRVTLRGGVSGNDAFFQVTTSPVTPIQVERRGNTLIASIQAPSLEVLRPQPEKDSSGLPGIARIHVFNFLPDQTSEIHFELASPDIESVVQSLQETPGSTLVTLLRGQGLSGDDAMPSLHHEDLGLRRIVIDPGHGGKDIGAKGPGGLQEKQVVLQIARFARQALVNAGYEVMLTRDRDFFLSLKNRTGLANQLKADLFLSIHVNAIKVPNAWGSETYYLSPDDTFSEMADINIQLENREFEQDEPELAQPLSSEEGVDLDLILWDLAQTEFMEDSFRIAKYIQEELNILAGTKNRGVKQAPLKVLKGARMPACLVEVAFLSNPLEEQRLKDEVFLKNVAEALATAVVRYDADVRSRNQQKTRMNGTP